MASDRGSLVTTRPPGLVDVLDRILDKGLVIAGDIKVSLANVELLTLQIRLLICSIDKAEAIGLNWWRYDRNLSGETRSPEELEARLAELEQTVRELRQEAGKPEKRRASGESARESEKRKKS